MRFLIDQDVYSSTITLLRNKDHDVVTAKELNMEHSTDEELLRKAKETGRIFITRDKDFGALVFLRNISSGVILIRMTPANMVDVHKELEYLLKERSEEELHQIFCVVEPNRYRFRKIKIN